MKVVGGLFALLFIAQAVQVGAISKISNAVAWNNNAVSKQSVVMNQMISSQNQMAAVGAMVAEPEPDYGGYFLYSVNGVVLCGYVYGGALYMDGQPSGAGTVDNGNTYQGCNGAGPAGVSSGANGLNLLLSNDTYVISGGMIPVMQFKLFLLGYINGGQITGKIDIATQDALKVFQKNRGLSQTGTYGPQTQIALDSVVSAIKRFNMASDKSFTFIK